MDQTLDAFLDLDERTEVGQAHDLDGDVLSLRVAFLDALPGIVQLLVAQAHALLFGIDLEHDGLDFLSLVQHLAGMLDAAPAQVADVDQSLDAGFHFDKGAEIGDVGDDALGLLVLLPALHHGIPGIALGLADAEADLVVLLVDADDFDFDGIAFFIRFAGLGAALPGNFADMHQPIEGTDIDEQAKGGHAADRAVEHIAHVDLAVELLALGGQVLVEQASAGEHQTALAFVHLEQADLELFAFEAAGIDAAAFFGKMRNRDKALEVKAVDHQPALDLANALDGDDVVRLHLGLEFRPAAIELAAPAADKKLRFFAVALARHLNFDLVADFGSGLVVDKDVMSPLALGQEAFALISYVNKPTAVGLLDHRTLDDLAARNFFRSRVVLGHKRGHIHAFFFNLVLNFFTHS